MNIFVGGLSFQMREEGLANLFEQYGTVESARVVTDRYDGRSKGFGFVEMNDEEAKAAIEALNGAEVDGRNLTVNEARPREERPARRFDNNRGGGDRGGYGRRY